MQMTEPTDRSMPPAMITTASPSANSEISEMWRTVLRRLSPPRNTGLSTAVRPARPTITASIVSSFFIRARLVGETDVGVGLAMGPGIGSAGIGTSVVLALMLHTSGCWRR